MAFPPPLFFRYLHRQSDEKIVNLFARSACSIYFVGHTHKLQIVAVDSMGVHRRPLVQEKLCLAAGVNYIISAGSVGQSRDIDYRAKYLIWDTGSGELEVRFVHYDSELTREKIRQRGFPEAYAMRLRKR